MSKYFFLSWKHSTQTASAIYEIEHQIAHELIPELEGKESLPFNFNLKRIRETKDDIIIDDNLDELQEIWLDYLPNSLVWPLMSEKLKLVVQENLTENEVVDWLDCKVNYGNEERIYYILRFNKILDVLNMAETSFVRGSDHIIRPVFSYSKVRNLNIFSKPAYQYLWRITSGLYVSEKLRKEIEEMNLTGLDFSKVKVI